MAGKVVALEGDRMQDMHAYLDEGIADGATSAVLILHGLDDDPEGVWRAHGVGPMTAADRVFVYQQLTLLEISQRGDDD